MKPLIAVTCVAVLAAIGYFGYGEYSKYQEGQRIAQFNTEREKCLNMLEMYFDAQGGYTPEDIDPCINRGLIDNDDINRARAS